MLKQKYNVKSHIKQRYGGGKVKHIIYVKNKNVYINAINVHHCLACIDSQAMSNLGYVVQLEVSTLPHSRNLGRHIQFRYPRKHRCLVRFAGALCYIHTCMLMSVMAGGTLQLGTLKAIASAFDSFSSS